MWLAHGATAGGCNLKQNHKKTKGKENKMGFLKMHENAWTWSLSCTSRSKKQLPHAIKGHVVIS